MTLTLSTGSFDQHNTFPVAVKGGYKGVITCSLQRDYKVDGDGIYWGLQRGGCVKATYTTADVAEQVRLETQTPVRDGDVVTIEGRAFIARVLGDYSNAVVFDAI